MNVKGKVALVTGGSMGVGRATSLALARAGAVVAVNYRQSQAEAEATLAAVQDLGGRGLLVQADVADDAAVRSMVATVERQLGALHILVNNAAITKHVPLADLEGLTDDAWLPIFDTNVRGTFFCARAAAPVMRRAGGGVIVNIGSVAGISGGGSSLAYSASKAAVHTMTLSLARALAPDIRVNCVAPGFIDTDWHARGLGEERAVQLKAQTVARTPLGRYCTPDDVAQAILSVIATDFMTGQILVVDGGASL